MKPLLAFALIAALGASASAQDRTNPDGNTDRQNPQQPIPQGPGSPGFGHGMPAGSRFGDDPKVDAQTDAEPTDRRGTRNEPRAVQPKPPEGGVRETERVETNPTPSRTDVGSEVIQQPTPGSRKGKATKPRKGKKSREDVQGTRKNGKTVPRAPVDKELPAVSDPAKDGTLIDDTHDDVPHD